MKSKPDIFDEGLGNANPTMMQVTDAASIEQEYLLLCKKELALKLELKTTKEEKKMVEEQLKALNAIGQVSFRW